MQWHKSSDISQIVISLVLRTRAITCDMPLLAIALPYNTVYTVYYTVQSIICSKMLTFRENRKKLIFGCASLKNQFSAIFSKNKRFRAYSASYSIHKHGHCGNFAPKTKSLRPSEAKIGFCA